MRIGLVAKKLGMTRYFDETGDHHPVTILECPEAIVTKLDAKNNNVQLASFDKSKKNINKPQAKEYEKLKSKYKSVRKEFKTDKIENFNIGSIITLNHFSEGQYVDIQGKTIGKGFAGGMKRHGFGGLEATHGVSISHRSHGSTGQCQDPGKVFKGKKMAGHMGDVRVTTQNLTVFSTDVERGLILIRGAVPGSKGGYVLVQDAVKIAAQEGLPFPGSFRAPTEVIAEAPQEETPVEAAETDEAAAAAAADAPEVGEPVEATEETAPAADEVSSDDTEKKD